MKYCFSFALAMCFSSVSMGFGANRLPDYGKLPLSFEANSMLGFDHVVAGDLPPDAAVLLINHRLVPTDFPLAHRDYQVPIGVASDTASAANIEPDTLRVGSGRNDEVILKLPPVAVVNEVDPRVDVFVPDL